MIVTVMSDASFCHETKASGWGIWIKSERGFFQGGGNFKEDPANNYEAEAMALAIAVHHAFSQGPAEHGDHLIIQTDCMMVIHALTGYRKKPAIGQLKEVVDYIADRSKEKCFSWEVRHVKAHAPTAGKRNYVNDLCDRHAKQYMKAQKKQRKEKEREKVSQ